MLRYAWARGPSALLRADGDQELDRLQVVRSTLAQILGRLFHNLDRVCRYRFVDQPELNQVFASLPTDAERTAAKEYMQARIERLHAFQQQDGAEPRWFDAPGGSDSLPKAKVEIDR